MNIVFSLCVVATIPPATFFRSSADSSMSGFGMAQAPETGTPFWGSSYLSVTARPLIKKKLGFGNIAAFDPLLKTGGGQVHAAHPMTMPR
jgi:hypothetical protein